MPQMTRKVRPKKALGQHFLNTGAVADRIASTLEGFTHLPCVEVGPGMGILTQCLLNRAVDLRVVEIDPESVTYLEQELKFPKSRIIEGDFLTMTAEQLVPGDGKFCVIGNYPYNISSQIFFKVLDWRDRVEVCSGMLQMEVARRLAAPTGSREGGVLSVLLQAWYRIEYLFTVEAHEFTPPPKVRSGVIRMTRRPVNEAPQCDFSLMRRVVKAAFAMRRKTLRNSLRTLASEAAGLPAVSTDILAKRPEQLTVEQFVDLTNTLYPNSFQS